MSFTKNHKIYKKEKLVFKIKNKRGDIWKQPRCPSADEWIRKLWYIYTMEYYSAIKKNAFESVLMRWMKPSMGSHSVGHH